MSLSEPQARSKLIIPDWDVSDQIVALTTTRQIGCSIGDYAGLNIATHVGDDPAHVRSNRKQLRDSLDDNVELQWLDQVHGTQVVKAMKGSGPIKADAVYSSEPGIACCIATADCLPVLMTNLAGDRVAAAHAGWKGLAAGVLEHTLGKFSCGSEEVIVWLGPAIGPCHFEVGAEVKTRFTKAVKRETAILMDEFFVPSKNPGKFMANLYGLASLMLNQLGVTNISGGDFCTYCQENEFYSFRRQANTGRMASLIYIKPIH
jgi:YfiH family protein